MDHSFLYDIKGFKKLFFLLSVMICLTLASSTAHAKSQSAAVVLTISSAIGPATADYIHRGFEQAQKQKASLIILKIDTPGGLDKSMRMIIQDILASPIPVISYVFPSGARAASAGTYILYASHIASMAPATNLGAATPVSITPSFSPPSPSNPLPPSSTKPPPPPAKSAMEKKIINDAIAYIKGLADLHQRNSTWAEEAVREGESLPAKEALKLGVINIISDSLDDLLIQLDGQEVVINGQQVILDTKNTSLTFLDPDWRTRFLSIITSPDVAYMLLLAGIYGLFFEFSNPGFVAPGIFGGICLVLGLYALQMLPISYAGLGLILLGFALITTEVFLPSIGIFGIGGTIAFAIGSLLLFDPAVTGTTISWSLILLFSGINIFFFLVVISIVYQAHQKPIKTGSESLMNQVGVTIHSFPKKGQIQIQGEIWEAISSSSLKKGQKVQVTQVEGLVLTVKAIKKNKESLS